MNKNHIINTIGLILAFSLVSCDSNNGSNSSESSNMGDEIGQTDLAPNALEGQKIRLAIVSSSPNVSDEIGDTTIYNFLDTTNVEVRFGDEVESGTYEYEKVGSNNATVSSVTPESGTGQLMLVFTSSTGGTFRDEFRDNIDSGSEEFFEGTFIIE